MTPISECMRLGNPQSDVRCPHCGRSLHQIVYRSPSLTFFTPKYEECNCIGAVAQRQADAAKKLDQLQQEAAQKHREKAARLITALRIPELYADCTLDSYRVPPGDEKALKIAIKYVLKFTDQRQKGIGLYMSGANGLGKTHLAYGIARGVAEQEYSVICKPAVDIMMDFRAVIDNQLSDTELDIMRAYVDCGLLIIDDLGKQQITEWSLATLFSILDARYRHRRPVIVTTNYPDNRLIARLSVKSDGETAASIVSRLHGMAYDVSMHGQDYRIR